MTREQVIEAVQQAINKARWGQEGIAAPTAPIADLLAVAKAKLDAMTPEEQAAMWAAQRESWVRGEAAMQEEDRQQTSLIKPPEGHDKAAADYNLTAENWTDEARAAIDAVEEKYGIEVVSVEHYEARINGLKRERDEKDSAYKAAVAEVERLTENLRIRDIQLEGKRRALNELAHPATQRAERAEAALAEANRQRGERLWLWKNFVNGNPEFWAFDNAFPCYPNGDPMTLGQPVGYAIFKESRAALKAAETSDEQAIVKIRSATK